MSEESKSYEKYITNSSNDDTGSESKMTTLEVKDQNTALNVLIHYITLAQKRGVFSIQESANIWSCIQLFIKGQQENSQETQKKIISVES